MGKFFFRKNASPESEAQNLPIGKRQIERAVEILKEYKNAKQTLESRIIEEEKWWRLRHWEVFGDENPQERCEPASAWLFNSIANKHADAMDNYPEPNVLPREKGDEEQAKLLSKIIPLVLENNGFEKTYSDSWWYKLRHGTAVYGVFWNGALNRGKGDIDITRIDLLNLFWEPGISDIQDSENLFIVSFENTGRLTSKYPFLLGKNLNCGVDIRKYAYDGIRDMSDKTVVVDWYYKKPGDDGREILHFCKFAGREVIFSTENDPAFSESGLYAHGKYPVVFDAMYPLEGTPCGFGMVAVMKSPQMYIDRLNRVILENSVMSARVRYFAKEGSGINEEEFLDWSKPIVHVEGSLDEERLKRIDVSPVSGNVLSVLQMKIDELKETSGNRDFSQGSTAAGVTAASAIAALQEAGNKISRDNIMSAYRAYMNIGYLIIDLIKQFYNESRCFRITEENGKFEYLKYQKGSEDNLSIFDISIKPQKKSSYSKLSQNEIAKEMYKLGFFNPDYASQALAAIEIMDFDGKAVVKEKIRQIKNEAESAEEKKAAQQSQNQKADMPEKAEKNA